MGNPNYSDKLNTLIAEEEKLVAINLNAPDDQHVKRELEKTRNQIHQLKMKEDEEYANSISKQSKPKPEPVKKKEEDKSSDT